MGTFYLLLGQPYESLAAYAKAIHVCSSEEACVSEEVLDSEREFLRHINFGRELPSEHKWVDQMLLLGESVRWNEVSPDEEIKALALRKKPFEPPVVIMGGGTDPTIQPEMEKYKDILYQAS